jgi:hypothetical protein
MPEILTKASLIASFKRKLGGDEYTEDSRAPVPWEKIETCLSELPYHVLAALDHRMRRALHDEYDQGCRNGAA